MSVLDPHMTTSQKQKLITIVGAVVLFLVFLFSPLEPFVRTKARAIGAALKWDVWHDGTINWQGFVLKIEKGHYGWTVGDNGDLTLFSRDDKDPYVIDLRAGGRAELDYVSVATALCQRARCTDFEQKGEAVGTEDVRTLTYVALESNDSKRINFFLATARPKVLVQLVASPDAFPRARADARGLVQQMIEQTRT